MYKSCLKNSKATHFGFINYKFNIYVPWFKCAHVIEDLYKVTYTYGRLLREISALQVVQVMCDLFAN